MNIHVYSPLLLVSLTVLLRTHIILKPVKREYFYIVVSQIFILLTRHISLTSTTIEFNSSAMLSRSSGSSSECALTSTSTNTWNSSCEYIII